MYPIVLFLVLVYCSSSRACICHFADSSAGSFVRFMLEASRLLSDLMFLVDGEDMCSHRASELVCTTTGVPKEFRFIRHQELLLENNVTTDDDTISVMYVRVPTHFILLAQDGKYDFTFPANGRPTTRCVLPHVQLICISPSSCTACCMSHFVTRILRVKIAVSFACEGIFRPYPFMNRDAPSFTKTCCLWWSCPKP